MKNFIITMFAAAAVTVQAQAVTKFDHTEAKEDRTAMIGATAYSTDFIAVDPAKSYRVKGTFNNPGEVEVNLLFGVATYGKDQKMIDVLAVSPVKGTETVLTADVSPEDDTILVKDASAWQAKGISKVVFGAKPDMSDLPNFQLSISGIKGIEKQGDAWAIKFEGAVGRDYAKGTAVRQHFDGNTFIYSVNKQLPPNSGWQTFEGILQPVSADDFSPFNAKYMRRGTALVKIIATSIPGNKVEFKDITFEEIK